VSKDSGYVLLHRSVLNSYLWQMPEGQTKVALTCLLLANGTEKQWWDGNQKRLIPRGTFITSQDHLAQAAKVSRKTVRTALANLSTAGFSANESAKNWTAITITNYAHYQDIERWVGQQNGQRPANDRPQLNSLSPYLSGRSESEEVSIPQQVPADAGVRTKDSRVVSPEAVQVALHLLSAIRSHTPEFKAAGDDTATTARWARDIDLAIRIDKRSPDALMRVIDWAHKTSAGAFWRPNLLSGTKLREKFDVVSMQSQREAKRQPVRVLEDL
jgi:hypothetical protein